MLLVALFIALLLAFALVWIKSLRFTSSTLSDFELERLVSESDEAAERETRWRQRIPLLEAMQRIVQLAVIVIIATILFASLAWPPAAIVLIALLLVVEWLALRRPRHLNERRGQRLLALAQPLAPFLRSFVSHARRSSHHALPALSKEELFHMIETSADLSENERARLQSVFEYHALDVGDLMTPWSKALTIREDETIGPLLLDRLHKLGLNALPVIGAQNRPLGVLYLHDLTPPNQAHKQVSDAMHAPAQSLPASAPLTDLFAASLRTGEQLFIVVNDRQEMVGIVRLDRALAVLLGERPAPKVTEHHAPATNQQEPKK